MCRPVILTDTKGVPVQKVGSVGEYCAVVYILLLCLQLHIATPCQVKTTKRVSFLFCNLLIVPLSLLTQHRL
jgi:hypothetical protein